MHTLHTSRRDLARIPRPPPEALIRPPETDKFTLDASHAHYARVRKPHHLDAFSGGADPARIPPGIGPLAPRPA